VGGEVVVAVAAVRGRWPVAGRPCAAPDRGVGGATTLGGLGGATTQGLLRAPPAGGRWPVARGRDM